MNKKKSETPELDKLSQKRENANEVSMFLDFLSERGIALCEFCNESGQYQSFHSTSLAKSKLIAEYLGIDYDKMEEEKQALLESLRKGNV